MSEDKNKNSLVNQAGQAMVEFTIVLIIVFAVCTGMLTVMRLLTFQFWARQEARFLAFEQEWVAHSAANDPVEDPRTKLEDGAYFGRLGVVSKRNAVKDVDSDGGIEDLLAFNLSPARQSTGEAATEQTDPVMLAGVGLDERASREPSGILAQSLSSLITPAVASERERMEDLAQTRLESFEQIGEADIDAPRFREKLSVNLEKIFDRLEVGSGICSALSSYSRSHGYPEPLSVFRRPDCASWLGRNFAREVAEDIDIPELFRDYQAAIHQGESPQHVVKEIVRLEIANQFFSFFDNTVRVARVAVPLDATNQIADSVAVFGSADYLEMIADARYLGSSIALGLIAEQAAEILINNPLTRDVAGAIEFENEVVDLLHTDAEDALPVISPYLLSPFYLPVPSAFGSLGGGLQEAVLKNLYAQNEDQDLLRIQLEEANKQVAVTYDAAGGLFASLDPVKGAEQSRLTANFYLITQPWHLDRRVNGTGPYREKGTPDDGPGEDSEEGVMRRRVLGMWVLPDNLPAFLGPLGTVAGLDSLASALESLESVSGLVSGVKRFATDNPLLDIAYALGKIPILGEFIPVPPRFPAVRPDAYPGSVELQGLAMDAPDELMQDKAREFKDYVEEQRADKSEADPKYED